MTLGIKWRKNGNFSWLLSRMNNQGNSSKFKTNSWTFIPHFPVSLTDTVCKVECGQPSSHFPIRRARVQMRKLWLWKILWRLFARFKLFRGKSYNSSGIYLYIKPLSLIDQGSRAIELTRVARLNCNTILIPAFLGRYWILLGSG